MPVVFLNYKIPDGEPVPIFPEIVIKNLANKLPEIIASHLSVGTRELGDGMITSKDVIVRVNRSGGEDINSQNIEIIVFAHNFPEREVNLEERKDAIITDIHNFFSDCDIPYIINSDGFVWIILAPTAFGKL